MENPFTKSENTSDKTKKEINPEPINSRRTETFSSNKAAASQETVANPFIEIGAKTPPQEKTEDVKPKINPNTFAASRKNIQGKIPTSNPESKKNEKIQIVTGADAQEETKQNKKEDRKNKASKFLKETVASITPILIVAALLIGVGFSILGSKEISANSNYVEVPAKITELSHTIVASSYIPQCLIHVTYEKNGQEIEGKVESNNICEFYEISQKTSVFIKDNGKLDKPKFSPPTTIDGWKQLGLGVILIITVFVLNFIYYTRNNRVLIFEAFRK